MKAAICCAALSIPRPDPVPDELVFAGLTLCFLAAAAITAKETLRFPRNNMKTKCVLIGSGGCNKKLGQKRCTYSCNNGPAVDIPIPCGPGNWDPACPWEIVY